MAIDYDAPRSGGIDVAEQNLDQLNARREDARSAVADTDVDDGDAFELPATELLDGEFTVTVVPMRADEFRCSRCFLVHHHSQLVTPHGRDLVCQECA
jgi:hypothetical protein